MLNSKAMVTNTTKNLGDDAEANDENGDIYRSRFMLHCAKAQENMNGIYFSRPGAGGSFIEEGLHRGLLGAVLDDSCEVKAHLELKRESKSSAPGATRNDDEQPQLGF